MALKLLLFSDGFHPCHLSLMNLDLEGEIWDLDGAIPKYVSINLEQYDYLPMQLFKKCQNLPWLQMTEPFEKALIISKWNTFTLH